MRVILLISLISCLDICTAQNADSVKFKILQWTLTIPSNANDFDRAIFQDIKNGIQNTDNIDYRTLLRQANYDAEQPIFTVNKKDDIARDDINEKTSDNIFSAAIVKADYNTWLKSYFDMIGNQTQWINALEKRGNRFRYDTASSVENIDGLIFHTYFLKSVDTKGEISTGNDYWFYTFVNSYELRIEINYSDEKFGEEYLRILRNSKFRKLKQVKAY